MSAGLLPRRQIPPLGERKATKYFEDHRLDEMHVVAHTGEIVIHKNHWCYSVSRN